MIACTSMLRDRYYSLSQTIWIWQNPGFLNPLPGWSEKLKVRRIWSLACGHLSSKADPTSVGRFSMAETGGSIEKLWIYWRICGETMIVFFQVSLQHASTNSGTLSWISVSSTMPAHAHSLWIPQPPPKGSQMYSMKPIDHIHTLYNIIDMIWNTHAWY